MIDRPRGHCPPSPVVKRSQRLGHLGKPLLEIVAQARVRAPDVATHAPPGEQHLVGAVDDLLDFLKDLLFLLNGSRLLERLHPALQRRIRLGALVRLALDYPINGPQVRAYEHAQPIELDTLARMYAPDLPDAVGTCGPVLA